MAGKVKRGQLSIELLAILGFMLALITPAIFFAYTKSMQVSQGFAYEKATETLERLSHTIAMVASSEGSSVRMRIEVPAGGELSSESFSKSTVIKLRLGDTTLTKVVPYTVVVESLKGGIYTVVVRNTGKYIEVKKVE